MTKQYQPETFELFIVCMVLVSLVHSIVLMRVCMHVIDRVFKRPGEKDL
jgi:hypothetical protein